jgi:hypothetical protein
MSCASHTMRRFVRALKKIISEQHLRKFCTFSFSLLLNSTDLESAKQYFKIICEAFLSETLTSRALESLQAIQLLVQRRPKDESEILKLLNTIKVDKCVDIPSEPSIGYTEGDCKDDLNSIKEHSPFTNVFIEIEKQAKVSISDKAYCSKVNKYYCPKYIDLLQSNFMPYSFIWISFALRAHKSQMTRVTNGTVERFIRTRKDSIKSQPQPASYALQACDLARGGVEQFEKYYSEFRESLMNNKSISCENEPYYISCVDPDLLNEAVSLALGDFQQENKVDFSDENGDF